MDHQKETEWCLVNLLAFQHGLKLMRVWVWIRIFSRNNNWKSFYEPSVPSKLQVVLEETYSWEGSNWWANMSTKQVLIIWENRRNIFIEKLTDFP